MADLKHDSLVTSSHSPYKSEVINLGANHRILLVVHQFSRTGAPYAVLFLARAITTIYGVKPVVISPEDGPIREEFIQDGFITIVDPLLFKYRSYSSDACHFVAEFDRVIVTSLASFDFIRYFRGISKKLCWWIHETEEGFNSAKKMGADLPLMFAACESVWLGSPLCKPHILQYAAEDKLNLLLYGCPDTVLPNKSHQSKEIVFSIIGTMQKRKGQDIFLAAIERLPKALRSKAKFRIIGSPLPGDVTGIIFFQELHARGAHIPELEFFENMPLEKLHAYYAETDVFVSASRDDPMPIVITEGLMYSKLCLCSSAIGHAQLLEDGKNGQIFANESAGELSEKMAWVIQRPDELVALGMAGRAVYEKYFLMSSFVANVENLLKPSR